MQEEDEHEWSIFTELIKSQTILKGSTQYLASTQQPQRAKNLQKIARGAKHSQSMYSIKKLWICWIAIFQLLDPLYLLLCIRYIWYLIHSTYVHTKFTIKKQELQNFLSTRQVSSFPFQRQLFKRCQKCAKSSRFARLIFNLS